MQRGERFDLHIEPNSALLLNVEPSGEVEGRQYALRLHHSHIQHPCLLHRKKRKMPLGQIAGLSTASPWITQMDCRPLAIAMASAHSG